MSLAVGHHTSSFFAPILKIPVVPRHQVITSRVDRAPLLKALSRTLKNISTYRRASPSFPRRFSHARHREDIFRAASGKIFADFRAGCCTRPILRIDNPDESRQIYAAPDVAGIPLNSMVESELPYDCTRAPICAFTTYQLPVSPRLALSLIPTTIFVSLLCDEGVSFFEFRIKGHISCYNGSLQCTVINLSIINILSLSLFYT